MKKTFLTLISLLLTLVIYKFFLKPKFHLKTKKIKYSPYADSIEFYTVGDGKNLKVGILSDSQLMPKPNQSSYEIFTLNLHKALNILYSKKVDSIIFAGDIANEGTKYGFDLFNQTYKSIFNKSSYEPILNIIMGNHDYLGSKEESIETMQKKFEESIYQKPFSHKVINNFHFINWGSEDSSDDHCNNNITWAREQIEFSIKNSTNENNPIFIITHVNPKNTIYGSDMWGNQIIYDLLNNYSQIISFSGHSHYPLIDERSIFQGNFTAIQTQSTSYLDCEYGFENGKMIKDEYGNSNLSTRNPMGIVMEINNGKINFERFSIERNETYGNPWVVDYPIEKKNFRYLYEERLKKRKKPFFENVDRNKVNNYTVLNYNTDNNKSKLNYYDHFNAYNKKFNNISDFIVVDYYDYLPIIEFKQAYHDDFIHHYKLDFYNEKGYFKTFYYLSDFFLMPKDRREYFRLRITRKLEPGNYTLRIYAVESFGKISDNYLEGKITQYEEPFLKGND